MGNPPRHSDRGDETDAAPDDGLTTETPRWVKVFGIIALVVVVLLAILLITGGHGPGRHTSSGDAGTPPAGVVEGHALRTPAQTQS